MLNIEITNKGIVVECGARQCVCAGWQDDGIGSAGEVGLHDGGAQGAVVIGCFADAIRWIGVRQIGSAVYNIGAGEDREDKDDKQ